VTLNITDNYRGSAVGIVADYRLEGQGVGVRVLVG
jgi:hypothetical protein